MTTTPAPAQTAPMDAKPRLALWCHANPDLAAAEIERLRALAAPLQVREALEQIAARKVIRHGDYLRCHTCGYKSVSPHIEERHAPNCAREIARAALRKDGQ